MVHTFKEQFLRFQLLFPNFYHFHHVIWGMKWAKKLKTKNGENMSSGLFLLDTAQLLKSELRILEFQHFHWLAGHKLSVDIPAVPNMVKECISNKVS